MKKNLRKIGCIVLAVLVVIGTLVSQNALAASTKYAYSIGVKHASSDSLTGDFTKNVDYAATCYGMMANYKSYYQNEPTVSYLRSEKNPNGVRKLASDVVFLNGHGSATKIVFGEKYGSGVYYGYNATIDGYKCAGLKTIGSMSSVDLISFVGCSTAAGSSNLPSVAVSLGAKTAVGFTKSIISRFGEGPRWLERYNDYLAKGYSVSKAVNYASSCYPDCTLSKYVKIYGSTSNTISSGLAKSIMRETYNVDSEISIGKLENVVDVKAEICNFMGFDDIITQIENAYPKFNLEDYRVTINMYSDDERTGMIIFKYFIDNEIATNKAIVIAIEDGIVTEVIPSEAMMNEGIEVCSESVDETSLKQAVRQFKFQKNNRTLTRNIGENADIPKNADLVETRGGYYYNYSTDELTYTEEYYYLTEGKSPVYVEDSSTWFINR